MPTFRYGRGHERLRREWARKVATGSVGCARCGEPILVGQPWDLGHVDGGGPRDYAGAEHRKCNRGAAPIAAWKALAAAKGEDDAAPRGGRPQGGVGSPALVTTLVRRVQPGLPGLPGTRWAV